MSDEKERLVLQLRGPDGGILPGRLERLVYENGKVTERQLLWREQGSFQSETETVAYTYQGLTLYALPDCDISVGPTTFSKELLRETILSEHGGLVCDFLQVPWKNISVIKKLQSTYGTLPMPEYLADDFVQPNSVLTNPRWLLELNT